MLTRLKIRKFKRFEQVEVELANPVVFLGPNNSGTSTAMHALVLWEIGLRRWLEKHSGATDAASRPGVTLSRQDLGAISVPKANMLWRNLRVRDVRWVDGRPQPSNIRIEIIVEGSSGGSAWECGLEFDYANEELFYCRPLRTAGDPDSPRMPIPGPASAVRTALLSSIDGIAPAEVLLAPGAVEVRIAEGRAGDVLRNLCRIVHEDQPEKWQVLAGRIESLFGVEIGEPQDRAERGDITMAYREGGLELDISAAGRGLHQTLLLLAYMYARPCSVLLLDQPDTHLEPLRQRHAYRMIREVARETGCQAIIATHSEILLNEAADQDLALAFVGQPHRIGREHRKRVGRSLGEFGFEHYLQAKQTGWVLYLSGPTDLSILQGFAHRLEHEAASKALQRPFVHYIADSVDAAASHFRSLTGVLPSVRALALLDGSKRAVSELPDLSGMTWGRWKRGPAKDYVCTRAALEGYASRQGQTEAAGPLFFADQAGVRLAAMRKAIEDTSPAESTDASGSSQPEPLALEQVFRAYRSNLGLSDRIPLPTPGDLVSDIPESEIDAEIREQLDAIARIAETATEEVLPEPEP